MTVRQRAIPFTGANSKWEQSDFIFSTGKTNVSVGRSEFKPSNLQGIQITESENHPDWNRRKAGSSGDIGGPFSSKRRFATMTGGVVSMVGAHLIPGFLSRSTKYSGICLPQAGMTATWPPYADSSDSSLRAYGTKAIAACKPTNAFLDLSTSLAELLRDRPDVLRMESWKRGVELARKAGSDYLNLQFGWKPIVDDVYNVISTVQDADAVLQQYLRDVGKVVRRRMDFPLDETTNSVLVASNVNAFLAFQDDALYDGSSPKGQVYRTRKTSTERWFSGAFTYGLPFDEYTNAQIRSKVQETRDLLSLDITPETLWNLAPWSWAVDWFIPVGEIISNLQDKSSDGLVLKYGYIMEHTVCSDTYSFDGPTGLKAKTIRPGSITLTSETKKRIPASPFGFGVTWDGLSPFQTSIALALGLSRS